MRFLKLYEDIYPGWISNYTNNDFNYHLNDNLSIEDIENIFLFHKEFFLKSFDINKLREDLKNDLGLQLFKKLNVDIFLDSIELNLKVSNNVKNYFDDYIKSINRRYRKIFYKDYKNYKKPEFDELQIIKDKLRNKNSYKLFEIESPALYEELTKMVLWVKENSKKVLITLDGRDTGGKGSLSRFILKNFFAAPLGRNIIYRDFGIPTEWQQKNWFHRYVKQLPKNKEITIFDRSWYNRAVNDPVMGYCTENQYNNFMKNVLPFEEKLIDDELIYIKLWLSIKKETQLLRFEQRKASPIKFWKYSDNDIKAINKWDDFTPFIENMFIETSSDKSPWVVVNMDDKPLGWLNSLRYILNKIPYENKNENILKVYPEILYEI